ncbi:MAG: serine hydrolase [Chloroflexota bacterium]|nr:serine hydrolase [Chloroflexota bacterium]
MRARSFAIPIVLILFLAVFVFTAIACSPIESRFLGYLGLAATPVPPTPTPTATPTPSPTPLPPTPTPTPNPDTPPSVDAQAVYLSDMDSGRVLASMHATTPLPMASTTKIMTAIVAIQSGNLDQIVTIHQDAVDRVNVDGGSSAQLVVGDQLTLRTLLYGLLIPSGADAAIAIADAVAGSPQAFVRRMNAEAARLGLSHTHFSTVDGLTSLSEEHYTTAADFTHLGRYAMTYPLFAQIVKLQAYMVPPTQFHRSYPWQTTNTLLATYPGMIGIKTGSTSQAGWCLVFAAVQNGHRLIGTILGSPGSDQRDQDAASLLDWGFAYEARHHL